MVHSIIKLLATSVETYFDCISGLQVYPADVAPRDRGVRRAQHVAGRHVRGRHPRHGRRDTRLRAESAAGALPPHLRHHRQGRQHREAGQGPDCQGEVPD